MGKLDLFYVTIVFASLLVMSHKNTIFEIFYFDLLSINLFNTLSIKHFNKEGIKQFKKTVNTSNQLILLINKLNKICIIAFNSL